MLCVGEPSEDEGGVMGSIVKSLRLGWGSASCSRALFSAAGMLTAVAVVDPDPGSDGGLGEEGLGVVPPNELSEPLPLPFAPFASLDRRWASLDSSSLDELGELVPGTRIRRVPAPGKGTGMRSGLPGAEAEGRPSGVGLGDEGRGEQGLGVTLLSSRAGEPTLFTGFMDAAVNAGVGARFSLFSLSAFSASNSAPSPLGGRTSFFVEAVETFSTAAALANLDAACPLVPLTNLSCSLLSSCSSLSLSLANAMLALAVRFLSALLGLVGAE